jgi:WD40 repeat protein
MVGKGGKRVVTGLASDALNRVVVASTLDGTINVGLLFISWTFSDGGEQFFDFHTAKLQHTLVLPSAVVSVVLHRDSALLAAVCDDMVVRVVDIETRRVVRELSGFRGRVLDIVSSPFYPAGRILLTKYFGSVVGRRFRRIADGSLRRRWILSYGRLICPPGGSSMRSRPAALRRVFRFRLRMIFWRRRMWIALVFTCGMWGIIVLD